MTDRSAKRRQARRSLPPAVYVKQLRRQVAKRRRKLAAVEAEIERLRPRAELVAELNARIDAARERAEVAEAALAEAE